MCEHDCVSKCRVKYNVSGGVFGSVPPECFKQLTDRSINKCNKTHQPMLVKAKAQLLLFCAWEITLSQSQHKYVVFPLFTPDFTAIHAKNTVVQSAYMCVCIWLFLQLLFTTSVRYIYIGYTIWTFHLSKIEKGQQHLPNLCMRH